MNNERATRFEVHPNAVTHGDQNIKAEMVQYIQWALGHSERRFLDHTFKGKLIHTETDSNSESDSSQATVTNSQRKRLRRIVPNRTSIRTKARTKRIGSKEQQNQTACNNFLRLRRNKLTQIIEGDQTLCTVSQPHKGMVVTQTIVDGKAQGPPVVRRMKDLCRSPRYNGIITSDNSVVKVNQKPITRIHKPMIHPMIGYIAPDEARPEAVLSGEFREADIKEMNAFVENQVMESAGEEHRPAAIKTRFRRTYKTVQRDGKKKQIPKSRFLICAYNDPRQVETATAVPSSASRRAATVFGLFRGWRGATIDVKTAFLLVPLINNDIYVVLPKQLPDYIKELGFREDAVMKLNKAAYGLKESPLLFNKWLAQQVKELGWEKLYDGIFIRKDSQGMTSGILTAYVDDLLLFSSDPVKDLNQIAKRVKCSDLTPISTEKQRHVGYEIFGSRDEVFFDIENYVDELPSFTNEINALGPAYARKGLHAKNLPFEPETDPDRPHHYDASHIRLMQRIVGSLCWLGTCHPAYSARHGMLAQLTHKPTPIAFRIAKGIIDEIQRDRAQPLRFITIHEPELRIWVDAAVRDYCGRRGYVVQLADKSWPLTRKANMITWRSASDKMKHASSTAGEVNAIREASEDLDDTFITILEMFGSMPVRLLTDSQSGLLQIKNGGHTIRAKRTAEYIRSLHQECP